MTTLVPGWCRLLITFLAGASTSLSWGQSCPPDRIFADGYDGVPVQRLVLMFTAQPSAAPVAATIAPAVQVSVTDECSDAISGKDVQIAIGPNPPSPAVLGGTLDVQSNALGTASFTDLSLDYLGNGYTLVATVSGPGGTFIATSDPFDETRVGNPCLGPDTPACMGTCADVDGDGLNDAWEIAGGIDLNGDGLIDAQHDLLLPGADPNVPDIYVQYDWMDYGLSDTACTSDVECTVDPRHAGETCSGPPTPNSANSCVHICTLDADCTSLGPGAHVGDRCIQSMCQHTHDPEVLAPGALQAVADAFATHGFHLHLVRGHALPHSHVVSLRLLEDATNPSNAMDAACEGGSLAAGTAGVGKYAESFYDLKTQSFNPKQRSAYHYTIFGHYSSCDSSGNCQNCPEPGALNPDGTPKTDQPLFGQTGIGELPGNDFIVSLANVFNDVQTAPTIFNVGGTFMHELGHNLGLHHGGGDEPGSGEDTPNYKPNYLSVMNYKYQLTGIQSADSVGSNIPDPALTRLDYSVQTLPTYGPLPLALYENGGLDETRGLASGTADIFTYNSGVPTGCVFHVGASEGPIDWDDDGDETGTNTTADLNPKDHQSPCDGTTLETLLGHTDWGPALGQSIFTPGFQCTAAGSQDGVAAVPLARLETTAEIAAQAHALYPPRPVKLLLPSAAQSRLISGTDGIITVILPGSPDFDVAQIDRASLAFHGARPAGVEVADANGDGYDDLLLHFERADVRVSRRAKRVRLVGWLTNSQVFVADAVLQ